MKTEGAARLLAVMAAVVSAAASAEPGLILTGEERRQVKTLQQELHRRHNLGGEAEIQSHLKTDRLRILTIPIDAEPGDLPHIQSAAGVRSPYGLPVRPNDNNNEQDQIWIWSAEDKKFKRRAAKYSDALDLENARILTGAAKISSASPYRLEIAPSSRLSGRPGEVVNVEFFLENVSGPDRYFFINAQETQGVGGSPSDAIEGGNLAPRQSFLERVSETKTLVRKGARTVIVVTLRIPSTVRKGQVNALALEAQPEYADTVDERSLTRRFYFTAIGDEEGGGDIEPPECNVGGSTQTSSADDRATASTSAAQQCDGFEGQLCGNEMWSVTLHFQDRGSGVRTLRENPEIRGGWNENEAFFWHDNFIIGSTLSHDYFYTATCCQRRAALTVHDVSGNINVCRIGPDVAAADSVSNSESRVGDAGLGGLTIAIIVVAALLALVVVGAGVAIAVIRNKRKAELAEMRQTPQAR